MPEKDFPGGKVSGWRQVAEIQASYRGFNYFADLRMTFRQNFFLQDWFRNKFGVGLG
jgi:hypothetical protein